jgi:hypothetical protein
MDNELDGTYIPTGQYSTLIRALFACASFKVAVASRVK